MDAVCNSRKPVVETVSAWSPFAYRAFALLWVATLISNMGTWMHDVGAGWWLTTLSPSPATLPLLQAAPPPPIFLSALFPVSCADRFARRGFLSSAHLLPPGTWAAVRPESAV